MFCFYILTWFMTWCMVGAHVGHTHDIKAEELRQKWGASSVIRDLDHIKEDLSSLITLADIGKLTEKQLAFYLLRMHDFDDNGMLDGIEMRVVVGHSFEHHIPTDLDQNTKLERIETVIDDTLSWDLNGDGFVDYVELTRQFTERESEPHH